MTDDGTDTAGRFDPRLLDVVDDVFCLATPEGELLQWNDHLADVTGHSASRLDGATVHDLCVTEDGANLARSLETAVRTGADRVTVDVQTANGALVPYEFRSRRVPGSGADPLQVVSVGRDVSEWQDRERELSRQNERLEAFAKTVAHDIRNPLNVIEARRELASQEIETGDGGDHLEKIGAATDRIDRIIEDVLWLAREGKAIGRTSTATLDEVVDDAWAMVAADAPRAELQYVAGDSTLEADDDRLRQLFENLFRNSVEHGGDDVIITVGATSDGFFIEDDGPGIPEDERDRVFDDGYSTNAGTGLGLSIVAEVADAHGWDVAVADGTVGGARFEFAVDDDLDADTDEPVKATIDDVWAEIPDESDST